MVAIPRQPEGLVESLFGARAARRRVRDERARAAGRPVRVGPGVLAKIAVVFADVFGTLVMCAGLTVGAFLLAVWAGWMVGALMVPLIEFKLLWSAKRHAAERAAEQAAER